MAQQVYVNHPLHIILCLLTGGLWLIVYIPLLLMQSSANKKR